MFSRTGTGSLVVCLKELGRVLVHGRDAVAQLEDATTNKERDGSWIQDAPTSQQETKRDMTVSKQTKNATRYNTSTPPLPPSSDHTLSPCHDATRSSPPTTITGRHPRLVTRSLARARRWGSVARAHPGDGTTAAATGDARGKEERRSPTPPRGERGVPHSSAVTHLLHLVHGGGSEGG